MANTQSSTHELKHGEPDGYQQQFETLLLFQYSIDGKGDYDFDYKSKTVEADRSESLEQEIERLPWIRFTEAGIARTELDIDIEGDTLVTVRTVASATRDKLFWSRVKPAIMTDKDRKKHYGFLEYWDGSGWTRTIQSSGQCRAIRFRARRNHDHSDKRHKFSYNVFLQNAQGDMEELEIDPDIKNPST